METLFKRHFWAVQATFVVAAAVLLAATVNGVVGVFAAPLSVAFPTRPPAPAVAAEAEVPELNPQLVPPPPPVVEVDLCADVTCEEDQRCNPSTGACEAVEEAPVDAPSDGRCIESDIAINLVGTMVSLEDPAWSLAILRNPSLGQTQFARIGTTLLTEATVTRIERARIFFNRNGREECLRPGDASARAARAPAAPARPTPSPVAAGRTPAAAAPTPTIQTRESSSGAAAQTIEQRVAANVRRNDDGSYEISRDLIQQVANDQQLMQQQAPRIVPNYVNGSPRGFRLQGVATGSIFSAIGVRNGDVILGVNGTPIDSPQRALELYQAMLQQERVQLQIERRGREQTLDYVIK
ncbi:MAG: PDZ domain-containing protein [Myxococcales bacterium]|nr:PDZ domain-containing protein [Myxococcales bacterium]MCB9520042.1 PDZ domain-containing protein [Myxococcales bacterium]